ncbi:MAG TPA: adenylate/guanylate cyclase domain-containing protein [Candidatus Dormibacteraeota bacterium]|nr:adenylate/guanylate cyclase domain-containing protein [Candidatus Dormibacteraeota bacterium]
MGRYIRYWYTYRTAVAVVIALVLTGVMFWLYTQQLACDAHDASCVANISVHPEDRFAGQSAPDSSVIIVGIDDASVQKLGRYPLPRDLYATALVNLEKAGAQVVGFDVGFTDPSGNDVLFARALASATVPVVLAYGAGSTEVGAGRVVQKGVDQIPLKAFRCADPNDESNVACARPYPNVILASTDLVLDRDGVVRRIPLAVQPACFVKGACSTPLIDTFGFAAYRAFTLGKDFHTGPDLEVANGTATFGQAWSTPTDASGAMLVNYSGPPGNFETHHQYVTFADVVNGNFDASMVQGKIVLVGYYGLTGVNDEQLATTSFGSNQTLAMAGVEIHANVVQMFAPIPPKFLTSEPPWVLLLLILVLGLATAIGVARVTVLWGLAGTVIALVLFTFGMSALSSFQGWVPDLFHPWLAIALTYSGVTAYRFLYENREKRKVTALFGQYLKPELVTQLARTRGGVADIMRGGERRDITLLFVDIRGFTSMSESMAADDVTEVVQMYLDHLSGIIFDWDGTIDKYVGDEIMAFWNAPRTQENHALLAVRCAYDLINRGPELQQRLLAKGLPPIRWGIGVNSGPAVVGMMGSRSRLQYTALGDTVNTAARFCSHAPAFHLLIGQETYEMCRDYIAVDLVPGVQLKGKSAEKFRIYEVTAIREGTDAPWVMFPTELATQAHQTFTSQYTQQTVIAASETGSSDILVGEEAQELLARQPQSPN